MVMPIEVLRVEQSTISKELARFRACDPETRSLYCREWAQYIHKKHFVWNAKTQEEVPESNVVTLSAGRFQINLYRERHHDDDDDYSDDENTVIVKKDRSTVMAKRFEALLDKYEGNSNNLEKDSESLIKQIIMDSYMWMSLPSAFSGLPNLFEPVEFNPYPDHIPLVDDPKDPSQILDPLIIERQSICLPSDCFHLLKNLTGDILLSHTTPTCHHTKPESKTPSDLEVDRAICNEHEAIAVKQALSELNLALDNTWQPLINFLKKLDEIESRRNRLMGQGCQAEVDRYYESQKYISFVDVFAKELPNFKKKKSTAEELDKIDTLFDNHFDHLKTLVKQFLDEFVQDHLKKVLELTTDLWKLIVPTIYEMGERMSQGVINNINSSSDPNSNSNNKIKESLKSLDFDSLKQMESTKEVEAASQRVLNNIKSKVDAYLQEIDGLVKLYRESSRPTLSSRVDRLNNKDFKKKIKKLESGYYTIRQTFRYEVTEYIFPESLFCKFSLVCLEPLMQEGEVMEAVTIEKEVKRFMESHQNLMQQRCALLHDFEEGVQTGRRELAGILGKLFLKEGMRIQGDNLALKRQNSLLKSMGALPTEGDNSTQGTSSSKKKSKKKKGTAASTSSGVSTPIETPSSPVSTTNTATKKGRASGSNAEPEKEEVKSNPSKPAATITTKNKKATALKDDSEPVQTSVTTTTIDTLVNANNNASPKLIKKIDAEQPKKAVATESSKDKPSKTSKKATDSADTTSTSTTPTSSVKNKEAPVKPVKEKKTIIVDKKQKPEVTSENGDDVPDWETINSNLPMDKLVTTASDPTVKRDEFPNDTGVVDFESLRADVVQQNKAVVPEDNNEGWATVVSKKKSIVTIPKSDNSSAIDNNESIVATDSKNVDDGWSTVKSKKAGSKVDDNVSRKSSNSDENTNTDICSTTTKKRLSDSDGWGSSTPVATKSKDNNIGNHNADKQTSGGRQSAHVGNGWTASNDEEKLENVTDRLNTGVDVTAHTKDVNDGHGWGATSKKGKNDGWSSSATAPDTHKKEGWNAETNADGSCSSLPTTSLTTTATSNNNTWGIPLDSKPANNSSDAVTAKGSSTFPKKKSGADSDDHWRLKKNDENDNSWRRSTSDSNNCSADSATDGIAGGWSANTSTNGTTTLSSSLTDGWGSIKEDTKRADNALGGWGTPLKSSAVLTDGWGRSNKSLRPKDTTPITAVSWGTGKLPWEEEPSKNKGQQSIEQQAPISTFNSRTNTEAVKETSKPSSESLTSKAESLQRIPATFASHHNQRSISATTVATPPPGITALNSNLNTIQADVVSPGSQVAQQMHQQSTTPTPMTSSSTMLPTSTMAPSFASSSLLVQQTPSAIPALQQQQQQLSSSNNLLSLNPTLSSSLLASTTQLQEPLPPNFNEMNADMLRIVVSKLHQENATLLRSVYSLQHDLSMMTNRYSEIMALGREREAQTLALFESKKQTEMEETRRYVLSLEARVKQLEEQLKNNNGNTSGFFGGGGNSNNNSTTAGFGSQDLFAGYRVEMSTTPTSGNQNNEGHPAYHHRSNSNSGHSHHNRHHSGRKLWQKNSVIRCGNCGEVGHASAECKGYCRYCGSLEHLSEACPMN
ncbi:hypothetical protein BDF20DRAFT_912749 [Mycotypha africana]|uniref:uncharacterized protein n=1 Tax=Mycotypha africana TaxID=64632 RepID=UPI0022FFE007|nr:uncharacterized protein BDF20DRAFT_912749 [Mycotypha africana]KAI8979125.1 hypothetical protein BDF20DRAFT_912749 [Mycotypha africana]